MIHNLERSSNALLKYRCWIILVFPSNTSSAYFFLISSKVTSWILAEMVMGISSTIPLEKKSEIYFRTGLGQFLWKVFMISTANFYSYSIGSFLTNFFGEFDRNLLISQDFFALRIFSRISLHSLIRKFPFQMTSVTLLWIAIPL